MEVWWVCVSEAEPGGHVVLVEERPLLRRRDIRDRLADVLVGPEMGRLQWQDGCER